MWDLTTALEMMNKTDTVAFKGGPSADELMKLLDQCDLTSRNNTPSISPAPSVLQVPIGPTVNYQRSRPNSLNMDTEGEEDHVNFYSETHRGLSQSGCQAFTGTRRCSSERPWSRVV